MKFKHRKYKAKIYKKVDEKEGVRRVRVTRQIKHLQNSSYLFVLIAFFLSFFVSMLFGLDMEKAKEIYRSYLSPTSEFHRTVLSYINNDLPIYRFLKIYMVGSTEKTETTKKTGDYLEAIKPLETANSDEERLARAVYLSYWEAKLNNRSFGRELVKGSPIFNSFFNEYQMRLVDAFGNYAQDLAAYLFGADVNLPYVPEELRKIRTDILGDYEYVPVYNGEELAAITLIMKEPEVVKTLSDIILESEKSAQDYDPEMLILRTRGTIFRSSYNLIAGLKDEIASEFVEITPKERNYAWIRWIIYAGIVLIWLYVYKNINIPLALIIASETVYIGVFMNMQSTSDGMIYGIVMAIALLFSIFYFLFKKQPVLFLISVLTAVTLFLPSFATKDLLMPESFSSSPFYSTLVNEVLEEPLSVVQRRLKDYNTTVNESIEKFNAVLTDAGIDVYTLSDEYVAPEAFEKRVEYVKELVKKTNDKNLTKQLNDFIYFETKRAKKVEKIISEFERDFRKFAAIGSDTFRNKLAEFAESKFQGMHKDRLLKAISSTPKKAYVTLPTYKAYYSLSAVILISLSLFLIALKRYEAFIPLVGALAVSVLTLFRTQNVFVQVGVPSLNVYISWLIPYTLVLSFALGFYWLKENHIILRRRERV